MFCITKLFDKQCYFNIIGCSSISTINNVKKLLSIDVEENYKIIYDYLQRITATQNQQRLLINSSNLSNPYIQYRVYEQLCLLYPKRKFGYNQFLKAISCVKREMRHKSIK